MALAGALVGGLIAEAALRVARFEFHPYPTVQFGYPDPVTLTNVYRADPELFWVPRDYDDRLRRARQERPAVVFMGDSCTEFGKYPGWAIERLSAGRSGVASGVALGVSGWSSHQGLAHLRRDVLPVAPRVLTIYYGWNDHWLALGPPDAAVARSAVRVWLEDHLRVAQLVEKVRMGLGRRRQVSLRVPLPEYRSNLGAMVQLAHDAGIGAVLITAPSNHVRGAEPEYLLKRHLERLDALIPLHRAYVAATRQAARASGAVLCDAAATFANLPEPHDRYFRADGIHLTDAGDRVMADIVAGCIEQAVGVGPPGGSL